MNEKLLIKEFKDSISLFPTGIAILSSYCDNLNFTAMTINSLTSLSLNPVLILFCIDKKAYIHKFLLESKLLTLSILDETQQDICKKFTKPSEVNWDNIDYFLSPQNKLPVFQKSISFLECKIDKIYDSGDHSIYCCLVLNTKVLSTTPKPMVYFNRNFRKISDD